MPDLPQIPGSSGPPQIPGAAEYSARTAAPRAPEAVAAPSLADGETASQWGERPAAKAPRRRRGRGRFRVVHLVIAGVIALVALGRTASDTRTPVVDLPRVDVPGRSSSSPEAGGGSTATVPPATVYRASAGSVAGHPRTIIELGVRDGAIRWIAASRFPRECSDGTSSSGLVLYTDEGTASGSGRTLRYATDEYEVTFRRSTGRGTFDYDRSEAELRCTSRVRFTAERVSTPALAQGLLDADRRAQEALTGG